MTFSEVLSTLQRLREGVRTQLWPVPALGILIGLALGVAVPRLDAHLDPKFSAATASYLFGGGPSAARTFLGAIAGSLITVTSLTFSLTVVTLQLASSQFSPRLLRTFSRDRLVHATLALFLGTFTYALAVLRTVRDARDSQPVFVPQVSVTLAFVLCLLSILGLVVFLAHLAQQIRVETMLRNVHRDARATVRKTLRRRDRDQTPQPVLSPRGDAVPLLAGRSGFLVQIDETALVAAAVDADAILSVDCWPGSSLIAGTPIGVAWARVDPITQDALAELGQCVAKALTTGFERTPVQDVGYGLRQLVDVANKALSPGINDPTSAAYALGHTSALLCELADMDLTTRILYDDHAQQRLLLARPDFGDLLEIAISQPRRYGATDPFVLARLFELLAEVAWCAREPDQRQAVADELLRLEATVAKQDFDADERRRLAKLADRVRLAEQHRWMSSALDA